jgi:hypothetical protein
MEKRKLEVEKNIRSDTFTTGREFKIDWLDNEFGW